MKTHIATFILIIACAFFPALEEAKGEHELTDYDRRVIDFAKKHGHYTDHPGYPEGHQYWRDLVWFHNAGDKVIPGLMYLLENEYKGQWNKMRDVISTLGNRHRKDRSDLLRHIRKNLPQFVEEVNTHNGGYIYTSLRCLSQHGDASDIPLMEKFAKIGNEIEKLHTRQDIQKLKDRLAKEKELSKIRDNRGNRLESADADNKIGSSPVPSNASKPASTAEADETPLWRKWPIMLAVLFVLSAVLVWLKAKSRA